VLCRFPRFRNGFERIRKVLRPIDRHRLCAAIATLAGIYVANGYSARTIESSWTRDDSLVYARNLALGNGLVFNAGERVEATQFSCGCCLNQPPFYWVSRLSGGLRAPGDRVSPSPSRAWLCSWSIDCRARSGRQHRRDPVRRSGCAWWTHSTRPGRACARVAPARVCILSAAYFARSQAPRRFIWVGIALALRAGHAA
jgi:hypothetical protein